MDREDPATAIRDAVDAEEATLCHPFRERDGEREVGARPRRRGTRARPTASP